MGIALLVTHLSAGSKGDNDCRQHLAALPYQPLLVLQAFVLGAVSCLENLSHLFTSKLATPI